MATYNSYEVLAKHLTAKGFETSANSLSDRFKEVFLKKGRHFIQIGDIEKQIAFIVKGLLRYYYITYEGDDVTKHFSVENEFASSYASLIYERPTAYGIIAEEDTLLLVMDRATYMAAILNEPIWERLARLYTEEIYALKEEREAALLTLDATERYKSFKLSFPNIESRLKQKHVATYLGIHPVSLSRLKRIENDED